VIVMRSNIVRASVTVAKDPAWVTFSGLTEPMVARLKRFAEPNGIVLIASEEDEGLTVSYADASAVHSFLEDVIGAPVTSATDAAETPAGNHVTAVVTAAAAKKAPQVEYVDEGPSRQSQREVDKVIRKFLSQIKARDIRVRRIGPVHYTWLHDTGTEYDDTGSDVRWEMKVTGNLIQLGCFDIKPFFRVIQGIVDAQLLVRTRKEIVKEMNEDAHGAG
jgi:hypothetical protein